VYGTLVQTVPDGAKTEAVHDVIAYFRAMLERVDSSLVDEWESLLRPGTPPGTPRGEAAPTRPRHYELARDERALRARARAELHALVRALSRRDFAEAAHLMHPDPDDPWTPQRLERALAPFFAEHGEIVFTPRARQAEWTRMVPDGPRRWKVTQVLLDPAGDNDWHLSGEIDLSDEVEPIGPLVRIHDVGR
jgi:hypothetical protein